MPDDQTILVTFRINPSQEHAIEKHLTGAAKHKYQSRAAFIRVAVFEQIQRDTATDPQKETLQTAVKLLNSHTEYELNKQDITEALDKLEQMIKFFLDLYNTQPRSSLIKLYETLKQIQQTIDSIDDDFWREYLRNSIQASGLVQQAQTMVQNAGYII